jgi:hypothetical protein
MQAIQPRGQSRAFKLLMVLQTRSGVDRGFRVCPVSPSQFYPEYAPDYYAIFFADPDGIRLEATNSAGKGASASRIGSMPEFIGPEAARLLN